MAPRLMTPNVSNDRALARKARRVPNSGYAVGRSGRLLGWASPSLGSAVIAR